MPWGRSIRLLLALLLEAGAASRNAAAARPDGMPGGAPETAGIAGDAEVPPGADAVEPGAAPPGAPLPEDGGGTAASRRDRVPTGQHTSDVEFQVDRRVRAAMQLLYQGRLAEASRLAEEARAATPLDPRVHILEARVLRESFPDQNAEHELPRAQAAPIHAALERAEETAAALLRQDPNSLPGLLYRGWAHMFRAQMHALCDEYWAAGRQAKHGKDDLDRVLRLDPGNPDARAVLGTYLYFADILPGVVKFARTLVRVPGGDRERGLELLQDAARRDGYDRLDARALLATIHFAFEGRFEDASREFELLSREYPGNARLLEPLAALAVYLPIRATRDLDRLLYLAEALAGSADEWDRQMSLRLRCYAAVAQILCGRASEARGNLEYVQRAAPRDPDWLLADVQLGLADLHLMMGQTQRAEQVRARLAHHPQLEERLAYVLRPNAAATPRQAASFAAAQALVRALYEGGDTAPAAAELAEMDDGDDPGVIFWRAEAALSEGRRTLARVQYQRLTNGEVPARGRLFKMLAFDRLAELEAASGDLHEAAEVLGRGLEYDQDRDLLRHLMKARRRFFELGRPGLEPEPAEERFRPAASGSGQR